MIARSRSRCYVLVRQVPESIVIIALSPGVVRRSGGRQPVECIVGIDEGCKPQIALGRKWSKRKGSIQAALSASPLRFEDSPCLHRVVADCNPDPEAILALANKWGLLTTAPEPLDLWRNELRALRSLTVPKLAEKLAAVRFRLVPVQEKGAVVLRYRATRFLDAIYQRFAEEFSGLIHCAQCPAPHCGRWFLKSPGRTDRRFCSHPCQMRAFRRSDNRSVT